MAQLSALAAQAFLCYGMWTNLAMIPPEVNGKLREAEYSPESRYFQYLKVLEQS